jgi:hypothetical protein
MPTPASERTPLLRSASQHQQNSSVFNHEEVTAAEVAQQGEGGAPQFPELGRSRSRSYSHGQFVVPEEDASSRAEPENLVKFQKNGKLEGVGVWKFRCVFGGILLGYFVSNIIGCTQVTAELTSP